MQILAFGDSGVEGFFDAKGGWVERLRNFTNRKMLTDKNFWCVVRNLGLSGDTSKDLLNRFIPETKARMLEGDKPIIIFGIGGNDSAYFKEIGNSKVPENEFKKNIKKLITQAKKFTKDILFIAMNSVDENKVYLRPWPGAFGIKYFYSNERIARYNKIIKAICRLEKINFIAPVLKGKNYKEFLFDGLHLNTKGHKMLFEKIKSYLLEKDLIK